MPPLGALFLPDASVLLQLSVLLFAFTADSITRKICSLIFRARRLLNPSIYLPLTSLQLTVKNTAFFTPLIKKIEPGYRASESRKTVSGFIVIKVGNVPLYKRMSMIRYSACRHRGSDGSLQCLFLSLVFRKYTLFGQLGPGRERRG